MTGPTTKTTTTTGNHNIVGDGNSQIIKDSFNTLSTVHGAELGKLFEALQTQAAELGDEMKGKDAKALQSHIATLAEEAKKPEPDKSLLAVTAAGLVEAANTVKDLAGPILATTGLILKFFGLSLP